MKFDIKEIGFAFQLYDENADKLLVSKIKIGDEVRQIVSGIAKYYNPQNLIGRKVVVVTNLKPVKIRGVESCGMVLCAADGEKLEIKVGKVSVKEENTYEETQQKLLTAKAKACIDQSLEYLVSHVYSELDLIEKNANSDADIIEILIGADNMLPGTEPNRGAASKMEEYLEMQRQKNLPTSMADIQSRYSGIPYGWKEIDIAAVTARLIFDQKVTIKYAGSTIQPDNPKLPDMLRKKSEIGKTNIRIRERIKATQMKEVKEFLRDYFDIMDVPNDEDGLIKFIVDKFTEQKLHYEVINACYDNNKYPDRGLVQSAITLMNDVLSHSKDNIALIDRVIKKEDELYDNKEAMVCVEGFFKNQVTIFDSAVQFEKSLHNDLDYIAKNEEAHQALNTIRLLTSPQIGKFNSMVNKKFLV